MGHLNELVKLNVLVRGTDELDAYIKNTKYFTSRYQTQSSDKDILAVVRAKIVPGQFYFFEYSKILPKIQIQCLFFLH